MNEIPHISSVEFSTRRSQLIKSLDANSLAIITAGRLKTRNNDAEFPFRQHSDFLYLTGFNEPEAIAVFIPNRKKGQYILFCRAKDKIAERWSGKRVGVKKAVNLYGVDQAFPIAKINKKLPKLMVNRQTIYYNIGHEENFDLQIIHWLNVVKSKIRQGIQAPQQLKSLNTIVHKMRLYKSEAEIEMMSHAAKVSITAHQKAMQFCQKNKMEYEIEAKILQQFRKNGMETAYTSIVGGGKNACILHYIENNCKLKNNDLLLIDAGAEHHGYASDITRTFPVNGRFTPVQKTLYQIVLDAQLAAIKVAIAGNAYNKPHKVAVKIITAGLRTLGLLKNKKLKKLIKKQKYRQFYMHNTGHWLGLDVHDVGDYKINKKWRKLEAGMVITVEPGIYISPHKKVDKKWWNIGIRIEDDVLITKTGNKVLTQKLVKEITDIETLMAKT